MYPAGTTEAEQVKFEQGSHRDRNPYMSSYTAHEAALLLRVHPLTIYRWIRQGKFSEVKLWKVGRMWRFDRDGFDKWLAGHTWEG
jgi:excisionase family DNA binding protein